MFLPAANCCKLVAQLAGITAGYEKWQLQLQVLTAACLAGTV